MDEEMYSLDFNVTICLGGGDGGDVCVTVDVSEEEYELLKECCREEEEIDGYSGLEDLCERIKAEAGDENSFCLIDDDSDSDEDEYDDYDDASYIIEMPDEILEAVESEESEEEEESIVLEDYSDYPFSMEIVNGQIISLTSETSEEILARILSRLQMNEDELADYLINDFENEDRNSEKFKLLNSCGYDALEELLGFDTEDKTFNPAEFGFFESRYGFEAKGLMKELDFDLKENVIYGPHGHGTEGVIYLDN